MTKLLIAAVFEPRQRRQSARRPGSRPRSSEVLTMTPAPARHLTGRRRLPVPRRRDGVAQLAAADCCRPARQGRPRRRLDLHLHQLAAHASLRPGLGREIQGPGARRDRRALAGVRVREGPRERPPVGEGDEGRLSDRGRQRHRDLARLQQRVLAGPLPHRREGKDSVSPVRRGRIRTDGEGHPATPRRGRGGDTSRRAGDAGRCPWSRVAADWGT